MTSRDVTGFLPLSGGTESGRSSTTLSDWAYRLAFGFIGWPWLLRSLSGGTKAHKRQLLARLELADDALPNLGSWKADTGFLHLIVDEIVRSRPQVVVELGSGASSLVTARALQLNGGGRLVSYDQHGGFVDATRAWLADHGLHADMHHAPLGPPASGWPGEWYQCTDIPERIDMIIIDGPPWTVHPYVRGSADSLFSRLSPEAVVLLDDAARPGERIVARRWREKWPAMQFDLLHAGTKGTLVGRFRNSAAVRSANDNAGSAPKPARHWRRAAAIALLLGAGWIARDVSGDMAQSAHATSRFINNAAVSHAASTIRAPMVSQLESTNFNPQEIRQWTGISLPRLPADWTVRDVQVYPSDNGPAVEIAIVTRDGTPLSLFATHAETAAEEKPMVEQRDGKAIAYWESGTLAYALTGAVASATALQLANRIAR